MSAVSPLERRRLAGTVARRAACPGSGADFFPEPWEDAAPAKAVCCRCPVREACLALALARPEAYGVWGGCTEVERDLLRHRAASYGRAEADTR